MIQKGFFACCLTLLTLSGTLAQNRLAHQPAIKIALVKDHLATAELLAMEAWLQTEKDWNYSLIDLAGLDKKNGLKGFTHIWYHRTDTVPFSAEEKAAGRAIKRFIKQGGNLFLSMEAVPLLNLWGIETTAFELRRDTLRDEGFGRPAGFHSFKSHPFFTGLNGGVYSTKQKKDHAVRLHGFFGEAVPRSAKVAGIQWTYITYTEQSKLLLEYDYGRGKIIAAGAYLYYGADNYNARHLHRFTENVFRYTAGQLNGKRNYWHYEEPDISAARFPLPAIKPVAATKWELPAPTLGIHQPVADKNFYDLVGRRILWMGAANAGADEIWIHPYMALRDLQLGVKTKGTDSITWLKNSSASVDIAPEYLTRQYQIKNTTVKEIYTVSFDQPCGVAHVEIKGDDLVSLVVRYASNLRYMWPYSHRATGSIRYAFSEALNGHVISGQQGALNTVVTYSARPVQQKIGPFDSLSQVRVQAEFEVKNNTALNVYIIGSSKSLDEAVRLFARNRTEMNTLFKRSNRYYTGLLKNHLYFDTPDTLFNKGYKWALARTDQFLQTTPGIGTSLMAGFGTTARGWNGRQAISGRPGYAWYFGRDGEWSAMAIAGYGDFKMVKETLETFVRFQDITGKIYHELSSSGAVHYDAADATPLFLVLAAYYLRCSGDTGYIRLRWPQITKALAFCYGTDTDGDGLIENTNVGHGWIEGGPMFGTHTEFYLAGSWAAALDAAAYMAKHIGEKNAEKYAADAANVKKIIDRDFWNEGRQFFYNGKMRDGSYMPDATVLAAVPVYFGAVTDDAKSRKVSSRFNSPYFSTDWGIRMIEDSSNNYRAGSYHAGMVWPLYGGWAALSEYKTGNYRSGFQHIMNNLLQFRHWSAGSIEETLNGDKYIPNGVCSHQAWSETMVLQPAIEGMLGLKPDAMQNRLQLSPAFPWGWNYYTVKNIRMKDKLFHLDMKRERGLTTFTINATAPVTLDFRPAFPLHTTVAAVRVNGRTIAFDVKNKPDGVQLFLSLPLKKGDTRIEVQTRGGLGMLPIIAMPQPGDSSKGAQVRWERIEGKKYTALVSGRPGAVYELPLYHKERVKNITGAQIKKQQEDILILQVKMQTGPHQKYPEQYIELELE